MRIISAKIGPFCILHECSGRRVCWCVLLSHSRKGKKKGKEGRVVNSEVV